MIDYTSLFFALTLTLINGTGNISVRHISIHATRTVSESLQQGILVDVYIGLMGCQEARNNARTPRSRTVIQLLALFSCVSLRTRGHEENPYAHCRVGILIGQPYEGRGMCSGPSVPASKRDVDK